MAISKVNVIAIMLSFLAFQHGRASATVIKVDQYLGTWYDVGIMFPKKLEPCPILCQWTESIPSDADDDFEEVLTVVSRRRSPERYQAFGTIFGSIIQLKYSDHKEGTISYDTSVYNNGYEMILRHVDDLGSSVLMSRNTTASTEAKKDFEELAKAAKAVVHYLDNASCFGGK